MQRVEEVDKQLQKGGEEMGWVEPELQRIGTYSMVAWVVGNRKEMGIWGRFSLSANLNGKGWTNFKRSTKFMS